jgi:hypothetical protein
VLTAAGLSDEQQERYRAIVERNVAALGRARRKEG